MKNNQKFPIRLIIWSKDRACQLSLLLKSIDKFAPDIFDIKILYKYSSDFFKIGYEKLIKDIPNITCTKEIDGQFQNWTYSQITTASHLVSFATDDSVIYRQLEKKLLEKILPEQECYVTSLRGGYNTIVQDVHQNTTQPPLNVVVDSGDWLEWPIVCYHPHENYGYPFSLDFHIFRRSLMLRLLEDMTFNNSSELEGKLTAFRQEIDYMKSPSQSVAVNIPINTAGGVTVAGKYHPISLEELNQKWLDGFEIDLDHIAAQDIVGAHQEIQLQWK